jgi:glutamyl-tRNA reductase
VLFCLTASHSNVDFDLLERVSHTSADATARHLASLDIIRGAVVLSTCNRFEAYLDLDLAEPLAAPSVLAGEAIVSALVSAADDGPGATATATIDADRLRRTAATHTGEGAVRHLFAVTAGLESMVVGEEEIAGQVLRAAQHARRAGTMSPSLDRLFQRAARTSRSVRAVSDVSRADRSLARFALDMASSRISDWAAARVLIVGTGRYAATTIASLRARGAGDIRVHSATGRAEMFAAKYGLRAEPELPPAIADADVVITCTSRYTVAAEDVRPTGRLLIIDLGLPRNVDPGVAAVPDVELLDLELLALHAPIPALADAAHAIIGGAASEFAADAAAAPAIVALRTHLDEVLSSELERVRGRDDDGRIEAALRHFAGVLAHGPSERARSLTSEGRGEEFAAGLAAVFGIDVPVAGSAADDDVASA